MGMNDFPCIRIDIESVRHTLIQALNSSLEMDKKAIETQVNAQLSAIDIPAMVRECVQRNAPIIVERAVTVALEGAIQNALWTGDGRAALEKMLLKGMAAR